MMPLMPSKLDLTLIIATVAALVGFIERGHSIVIAPPEAIELAKLTSARSCADDEDMRYGTSRMVFLEEGFISAAPTRRGQPAARSANCESK
jgi:hypothetical protein